MDEYKYRFAIVNDDGVYAVTSDESAESEVINVADASAGAGIRAEMAGSSPENAFFPQPEASHETQR